MYDEQGLHPYFSNPVHIRSIKSFNSSSSALGSPKEHNFSTSKQFDRANAVKYGQNPMPSPGSLIKSSFSNKKKFSTAGRGRNQFTNQFLSVDDIMPSSDHSDQAGDVSFESKFIEQDYDQICLKVHLHPLHHVAKSLLSDHFKKNGGGTEQSLGKILQSKSTLAINVTLWSEKRRNPAILVIASGILLVASKDSKNKLMEPLRLKSIQSLIVSHNSAGMIALHLSEAVQVMQGFSHLILETASLGLFLRYILISWPSIKLDFADSICLSENGCIEELYFSQLVDHFNHVAEIRDLSNSQINNTQTHSQKNNEQQHRMSQALLSMNTKGLISSRSDVIALLSGELRELRTEKSLLFKTSYHWDPHYYLLTSIGILRFEQANMSKAPSFVPLKHIVAADLLDCTT